MRLAATNREAPTICQLDTKGHAIDLNCSTHSTDVTILCTDDLSSVDNLMLTLDVK